MGTQYVKRVIIIIPASYQQAANQAATQLDSGGAGQFTFTVPLNPSGLDTDAPTHYWCSTVATEEQYQQILAMKAQMFPAAIVEEWDMEGEPSKPDELLASLGLKRIEAQL